MDIFSGNYATVHKELIKKFDEPVHSIRFRQKYVENYRKNREMKIAVKKFIKKDNSKFYPEEG